MVPAQHIITHVELAKKALAIKNPEEAIKHLKAAQEYSHNLGEGKLFGSQEKEIFYLEVDRQLKTNRKLLKTYNYQGFTTVQKAALLNEGFNPNFFTYYWKNSKGDLYLFVYDYGFLDLKKSGKDKYLIVQWQEYMRS